MWGWEKSHQSIWYQLAMVSYIKKDLRLSGRCKPLSGAKGLDKMFSDALKVVQIKMREVICGLFETMPCRKTHGRMCGWTRGRRPLQCLLLARALMFRLGWTGWNYPLESPNVSEKCVNRLLEEHSHRGVLPGGVLLQVMHFNGCLLGSLGFWSPINRETSSLLGFYLNVSCFEGFFLTPLPPYTM